MGGRFVPSQAPRFAQDTMAASPLVMAGWEIFGKISRSRGWARSPGRRAKPDE